MKICRQKNYEKSPILEFTFSASQITLKRISIKPQVVQSQIVFQL